MPDDVEAYEPQGFVAPPKAPKGWAIAAILCGIVNIGAAAFWRFAYPTIVFGIEETIRNIIMLTSSALWIASFLVMCKAMYEWGKHPGKEKALPLIALTIYLLPGLFYLVANSFQLVLDVKILS